MLLGTPGGPGMTRRQGRGKNNTEHPTLESSIRIWMPEVAGSEPRQVLHTLVRDEDVKDFCCWALITLLHYEANAVTEFLGETSESMYPGIRYAI